MGRLKKIKNEWNHREKFQLCLSEAKNLEKDEFIPEIDNLESKKISNILFRVLHEWDMCDEGEINVSKGHINRVERFIIRWRDYVENEEEKVLYKKFKTVRSEIENE
ncbi:hypothetical protein [Virgibacillus sp. DJP39]|uniref:hypothetical protein n=1 Tax=Virgibacillus sp. DJP39 TaxID=3409790 RepID=UPI003BB56E9C